MAVCKGLWQTSISLAGFWEPKVYWRSHLIGDKDLILALSVDLDTTLERA